MFPYHNSITSDAKSILILYQNITAPETETVALVLFSIQKSNHSMILLLQSI